MPVLRIMGTGLFWRLWELSQRSMHMGQQVMGLQGCGSREPMCAPRLVPPTQVCALTFMNSPMAWMVLVVWDASSRVGERMRLCGLRQANPHIRSADIAHSDGHRQEIDATECLRAQQALPDEAAKHAWAEQKGSAEP